MKGRAVTAEVVEPYAQALMSVAKSHNLVERIGEDATAIRDTLKESQDLRLCLDSPIIQADKKKAVLRQVFGEAVHPFTLNFLMLLVDRRRIGFLDAICAQYQALQLEVNQAVLAEVTSAVELNDAQRDAVRQRVMAMTGARDVVLELQIDPDLIGGVIIKVGSQVIDASLRGQLRRIGLKLSSAS
ncbi:MAG TPA: F0F1 ATP synthase subunit delta [Synechococcales cyanobacterium M55_K2018_004]|nr:F0F1 ATP synthase subunit delta [Synechococcales cyanobacterium M55_K2018_004]